MKRTVLTLLVLSLVCSDVLAQITKKKDLYPDDPAAREEYNFMRLRDPNSGEIPPFITQKEFEFASKLPKHNPFSRILAPTQFDWQPPP